MKISGIAHLSVTMGHYEYGYQTEIWKESVCILQALPTDCNAGPNEQDPRAIQHLRCSVSLAGRRDWPKARVDTPT